MKSVVLVSANGEWRAVKSFYPEVDIQLKRIVRATVQVALILFIAQDLELFPRTGFVRS